MSISSYTTVTMLDSRPAQITISVPKSTDITNRIITFKDLYGSSSNSTIILVTRSGDTFEDGTFSTIMSNAYQTVNLYAGQPGKWLNVGATGGGGDSAGLTTVSNRLNGVSTSLITVSTNLNTVSNHLNALSTNIITVSTSLNTVSNHLNSLSTSLITVSTSLNTVSNTVAAGRFPAISTTTISTSLIRAGYISSPQGYISSLIVDSLSFSLSNSFIVMGDIITTSVSTIQTFTSSLTTNNLRVGTVSTLSYIAFPGLQQGYAQTVIAEQATASGIQELLLFKGSTNTDRIRMQTTGPIVFEPGVSARVFPATGSNVTPAMIITTGSNVGIGVAAPGVALDVAGAGRFTALSTNIISTGLLTASNISTNTLNSSTINISSVGINCNSPSYTLDVNGNARVGGMFFNTNAFAWTNGTTHTLYGDSYTGSTKYIQWAYNNTPGTTIADAANMNIACPLVGINCNTPGLALDVAGAGRFTGVSTTSISTGTILANNISTNIISTATILANTISTNIISTATILANTISTNSISTGSLTVGGTLSARLPISTNNTTLTDPASIIIKTPNTSYFYADYTNLTNYITISNYGAQNGDYINIVNTGNSGAPATFQVLDGSTGVSSIIRYIYPGHAGVVAYSSSEWLPL